MAKISKITTQRRSKHRYNIFLDDGKSEKYGFSVDEDVLIDFNLRKGMELNEAMVLKLVNQDSFHKSYAKVINYLGFRMRTKKEIRDYLIKDEVDEEHIKKIMDKLIERKLVNDGEFAELFVNTRMKSSAKGPTLVKQELMRKGVSSQIANEAVENIDYNTQYEKATKVAEKRLRRNTKDSFRKQMDQLRAALMRNGFTGDVIKAVIDNIDEEEKDVDEEWEGLVHHGERFLRRHQKLSGYELRSKVKQGLYGQGFALNLIDQYLDEHMED